VLERVFPALVTGAPLSVAELGGVSFARLADVACQCDMQHALTMLLDKYGVRATEVLRRAPCLAPGP
jgi:hypothetical protein